MNLGKFGVVVNALAVSWVVFLNVIYCFPTRMPVSEKNMNYVSVVCAGMMGFILLLWFTTKKKTFVGPTIDIKALHARREEAMQTELTIINAGHTSDSTVVEEESISEKKDKEELGIKISHTAITRRLS
jgi:choline transport protein